MLLCGSGVFRPVTINESNYYPGAMKFKGNVIKGFLISLVFILIPISAFSAQKVTPGSTCKTLNQKIVYMNKTYTCIKSGKKIIWNKGVVIAKATPTPSPTPVVEFIESGLSQDPNTCKLIDARTQKRQPNNVGFPLEKDLIPANGNLNVIVIPVDFSDRPGGQSPLNYLTEQMSKMNDWYKFFSGNKVNITFQIGKEWVRAPKADSEYVVPKSAANSPGLAVEIQNGMAQDLINASKGQFDFTKSNIVFFYMPTIKSVDYDMGGRGVSLTTSEGAKDFFYWGGGAYHFDDRNLQSSVKKEKMWAFWTHEMLHSQGLALHAPANGSSTGLHTSQYGSSLAIDSWELFRLGWIEDSNVACLDKSKDINHRLILRPTELGSQLARFTVIKLNAYEALVIESRRPVGYSKEWNSNQSGILVFRIDTRNDNDRSGESSGDTGNSEKYSKWAYLLSPDNKNLSGISAFDVESYIVRVNQTITYSNIKIKLLMSASDKDLVEISKL